MRAGWIGGAAVAAMALVVAGAVSAAETVTIDTGALKGVTAEGVVSFRGIPYAAPPVGSLRWRPPAPAKPWSGVRSADQNGALCMQKYNKTDNGVGPLPMSEDCLTLNVFAPAGATKLPVMVWIHGGGLVNGSGTAALYDGAHLAQQGVVVVSMNYRLGRFGFFAHPALTAEAHGSALGNYGFMDQIAALKWVKRNIKAFGGDPGNVTLFGESAGGVSVNHLMLIPEARGLFHKAIVQSGVGREEGASLDKAEAAGRVFADRLGITDQNLKTLRAIPAEAIIAQGDPDMMGATGLLVTDGRYLKSSALAGFRAGETPPIPYMVGSNSLEFPPAFAKTFRKSLRIPDAFIAQGPAVYGSQAAFDDRIVTDAVFTEPARALAKAQAAKAPTYLYRFSVYSEKAPFKGAIHASDREYVFDTLNASPWPTSANDAAQAKTISAYWVDFAKTGDPNGARPSESGRPLWPRYDGGDQLIDFTNAGPVAKPTPDAQVLDAVGKAADAAAANP
jgi:para-nitrobenzyl esterase